MPGRQPANRLVPAAITASGLAALAGLAIALPTAAWTTRQQGWWEAGYLRLTVDAFWSVFDLAFAIGAALLTLIAALLAWRTRARSRAPLLPTRIPTPLLSAAAIALVVASLLRAATLVDAARTATGPNLLLISIDTLRADRLGAYGHSLPTSPTFDRRLAAPGTLFERAYSQSPKTTPSHMTILTSLQPCVHGIELWENGKKGHILNPKVMTLAEVLRNAGYRTAAFTGGGHVHRSRGFDAGFEVYWNSRQLERSVDWMERNRNRNRKWFLFFHTYEVHDPYKPPARLIEQFDPDYRGPVLDAVNRIRPSGVGGWAEAQKIFWASVDKSDPRAVAFVERLYDAGIREMDDETLTPLLDTLDRLDLTRDTLIVFTSDHGEAFGEHGRFLHEDLYSTTTRVPLVIRFPGRVPEGQRIAAPVASIDLMPTVLDLLGVAAPPQVQGRSLVPLLGAPPPTDASPPQVSQFTDMLALRHGGYTYLAEGATEMLFDAGTDTDELHDLAGVHPEQISTLRADVAHWHDECARLRARFGPGDDTVAPDEKTVRQLRALGYVE